MVPEESVFCQEKQGEAKIVLQFDKVFENRKSYLSGGGGGAYL